ncbi:MAG: hypothetical protein KAU48_01840 [Candidatus Thorarchaeota archaeon]|nr:hypothetical protein [Candidatus Thorarchaeota archaeon]
MGHCNCYDGVIDLPFLFHLFHINPFKDLVKLCHDIQSSHLCFKKRTTTTTMTAALAIPIIGSKEVRSG